MGINRVPLRSAICLLFLLTLSLCFVGCSSKGESNSSTDANKPPVPGYTTAHFSTFELTVPENWSVRGNVGKLYEGDGMFLLAGPLEETDGESMADLEVALSEELELFFNTDYYRSKIRFQYDSQEDGVPLCRVTGTLLNDRNDTSLRFAGAYSTSPGSYFVYFWPDVAGDQEGRKRAEVSYEHFNVL